MKSLYIYETEMSVRLSICPSRLEAGWRGRQGGWTGRRGQWGGWISTRLEGGGGGDGEGGQEGGGNGEGDFTNRMPGWTYFSQSMPGHPASTEHSQITSICNDTQILYGLKGIVIQCIQMSFDYDFPKLTYLVLQNCCIRISFRL